MHTRILFAVVLLGGAANVLCAGVGDSLKRSDDWLLGSDGREAVNNVLSHQARNGSWPKNTETADHEYRGKTKELSGTFDNGATLSELRLLARVYRLKKRKTVRDAFDRGLACILDSQYTGGGWPQSADAKGYARQITFNDGAMVGVMQFLRDVHTHEDFDFVSEAVRSRAAQAFDGGVKCILDCQVRVDGKLTVWCAQHDRDSLQPCGARSYEHPSLSGGESAKVVCLLMSLDAPSTEIRKAVRGAVEWYRRSAIPGIRIDLQNGDRRVVSDPSATPLWARFYEISTNRPIFSGRDGVVKYDFSEIEAERRNGYSWYVNSGQKVESCWHSWDWK